MTVAVVGGSVRATRGDLWRHLFPSAPQASYGVYARFGENREVSPAAIRRLVSRALRISDGF